MGILCAFALTGGVIAAYAEDLPTSYEQYLDLKSPSDFAVNDDYIAIADGNKIYLYDKSAETQNYLVFSHTSNVSSLNFYKHADKTYLYFAIDSAGDNPIQYIDCTATDFAEQTPQQTAINSCSSFIIYGDQVCFANASNSVYLTRMDGLDIVNPTSDDAIDSSQTATSFAVYDQNIYFAKGNTIYIADTTPGSYLTTKYSISSLLLPESLVEAICSTWPFTKLSRAASSSSRPLFSSAKSGSSAKG